MPSVDCEGVDARRGGNDIDDGVDCAYFVDVKNIGKPDVLAGIAAEHDLAADEATDVLLSRKYKDAIDEDWRRCAALKVNAVPTFLAGRYMMVGAQPYEELERLVQHVMQGASA